MSGNLIVTGKNFLKQCVSFSIAEGQMSTDHRKENNPAAPNIHEHWIVGVLALNHFRGSVAR